MITKNSLIIALLLLTTFVATMAQANSPVYPGYVMRAPQMMHPYAQYPKPNPSPVDILESSIGDVLKLLSQPKSVNIKELRAHVKNKVAPNFDFDYMSKWVAGKRYYLMSKEQQASFKNKFTKIFLSTFINKLTKDTKALPKPSNFRSKRQTQNEARASVLFTYNNGLRVKVDFRFFRTARGWKVVDVKANGISALLYFRNYFVQLIKQRQSQK